MNSDQKYEALINNLEKAIDLWATCIASEQNKQVKWIVKTDSEKSMQKNKRQKHIDEQLSQRSLLSWSLPQNTKYKKFELISESNRQSTGTSNEPGHTPWTKTNPTGQIMRFNRSTQESIEFTTSVSESFRKAITLQAKLTLGIPDKVALELMASRVTENTRTTNESHTTSTTHTESTEYSIEKYTIVHYEYEKLKYDQTYDAEIEIELEGHVIIGVNTHSRSHRKSDKHIETIGKILSDLKTRLDNKTLKNQEDISLVQEIIGKTTINGDKIAIILEDTITKSFTEYKEKPTQKSLPNSDIEEKASPELLNNTTIKIKLPKSEIYKNVNIKGIDARMTQTNDPELMKILLTARQQLCEKILESRIHVNLQLGSSDHTASEIDGFSYTAVDLSTSVADSSSPSSIANNSNILLSRPNHTPKSDEAVSSTPESLGNNQ